MCRQFFRPAPSTPATLASRVLRFSDGREYTLDRVRVRQAEAAQQLALVEIDVAGITAQGVTFTEFQVVWPGPHRYAPECLALRSWATVSLWLLRHPQRRHSATGDPVLLAFE